MGSRSPLASFIAEDSFLRHVDRNRHIKGEIVSHEVFLDIHPTLSFTYQDEKLRTDEGLDAYQRHKALPSGDLPGLCKLTFHDFTCKLEPPLPPWHDKEDKDEMYGHLHCSTERPTDAQRTVMAELATRNAGIRRVVRRRK